MSNSWRPDNDEQQAADHGNRLTIPSTMDDITAEWLTAALRAGGREVVVSAVSHSPLAHLKGMLSSLGLFGVEYSFGTGPSTVVVKIPTDNDANREIAVQFHCYEREVRVLNDLAKQAPDAFPEVYYGAVDAADQFVLIMEDLTDYRSGDQVQGCSAQEASLALAPLARFHAAFWDKVDSADFNVVPYHYPSYFSESLRLGAIAGWDNMITLFGESVPPYLRDAKHRYLAAIPAMQEWITRSPITLVHGDFRLDNMFFGQQPNHRPFITSDLQGCVRGKGVHDLAYFLSQSLHIDDRRSHERDLVSAWHQQLVASGVQDYTAEQAWDDYERAVLYMWTYVAINGGGLDPMSARGMGWLGAMVERAATAIDDLQLLDRLDEFEHASTPASGGNS